METGEYVSRSSRPSPASVERAPIEAKSDIEHFPALSPGEKVPGRPGSPPLVVLYYLE